MRQLRGDLFFTGEFRLQRRRVAETRFGSRCDLSYGTLQRRRLVGLPKRQRHPLQRLCVCGSARPDCALVSGRDCHRKAPSEKNEKSRGSLLKTPEDLKKRKRRVMSNERAVSSHAQMSPPLVAFIFLFGVSARLRLGNFCGTPQRTLLAQDSSRQNAPHSICCFLQLPSLVICISSEPSRKLH